jgi:hypothetical protein
MLCSRLETVRSRFGRLRSRARCYGSNIGYRSDVAELGPSFAQLMSISEANAVSVVATENISLSLKV